ncbi:hypothetical protein CK501_16170 [Halovibrio salipaludis]|uniref:YiiM-like triple helical domain-containing protein n=1 Tax=Halovibrio salipaludis TaxID=2032626 RepID=A0A2A2EUM7_9GAMM|nr:tetratricopeptide repeat protein [Halovibrio salipaludis]PAU76368.1 hypothetical protein CK501_16170 [Halovibrio salipaludis]
MSLLNDALRDLEKREGTDGGNRDSIPAGLSATSYRTPSHWRWILGGSALLLALLASAGFWWLGSGEPGSGGKGAAPALNNEPVPVIRTATLDRGKGQQRADSGTVERSTSEPAESTDEGSTSGEPSESVRKVKPARDPEPESDPEPEPKADPENTGVAEQAPESPTAAEPEEPTSSDESANQSPSEPAAASVRELTPAEKDRRLSRELEALLADGRVTQAGERLSQRALLDSDAPRSRAVMARHALERGEPAAALQWLPEQAVALYPELRLLRARVALERSGRASALQWLESEPPGPGTMPAYHTMMAALYQQTGDHQAAAEQWAALIETDDGNARWWAGLGIAMESRGRDEQARAAYTRALSLPELAPELRRYIEQRLAAEQG